MNPQRPHEGEIVITGPHFVRAPLSAGGPAVVSVYVAEGVRRYVEHGDETIAFVDCREDQSGRGIACESCVGEPT